MANVCGEAPEQTNAAVPKAVVRAAHRGFELHPLRQLRFA